eukprot:scaffold22588_cov114-Cylindrotheca_fusiformis.AAC.1
MSRCFILAIFALVSFAELASGQVQMTVCGEFQCVEDLKISCDTLVTEYVLQGSCCSLEPIPAYNGCRVTVGSGNCYWTPKCGECPLKSDPSWADVKCNMEYRDMTNSACPAASDYPTNWASPSSAPAVGFSPSWAEYSCEPTAGPQQPTDPPSIEAEEIEKSNIVNTAIIVTIIGVLLIGCLCYKASQEALENRRDLSATRHAVSQRRGGRTEAPHPVDAAARREEILSHFFCQHVLPDKSNASLSSLRFTVKDAAEEKGEQEDFEDRQSPVESTTTNKQKRKTRRQSSASISSILMAATWRKPAPEDECCICLERYQPGDAICASKATECHHIFHQDCVLEWMMRNHDCCPLCRVNLME